MSVLDRIDMVNSLPFDKQVDLVEHEIYKHQRKHVPGANSPLVFGDRKVFGEFYVLSRQMLRNAIARNLSAGVSPDKIVSGLTHHVPGPIHIGGEYETMYSTPYETRRRRYVNLTHAATGKTIRTDPPEDPAQDSAYQPVHVASGLSHESLHKAMHKVAPEASAKIDTTIFGHAPEISPTGIVDFEILRRRMVEAKRYSRRFIE